MTAGLIVAVVALLGAGAGGLAWRRRDGHLRDGQGQRLTVSDVGQPFGQRGTLLQFSSAFCAPCRAARQVLAEVAATSAGISHVEIDVADRLDLVRRLDIRRTPTVLVLDPEGEIARRASGVPRRAEVIEALALDTGSDSEHGYA